MPMATRSSTSTSPSAGSIDRTTSTGFPVCAPHTGQARPIPDLKGSSQGGTRMCPGGAVPADRAPKGHNTSARGNAPGPDRPPHGGPPLSEDRLPRRRHRVPDPSSQPVDSPSDLIGQVAKPQPPQAVRIDRRFAGAGQGDREGPEAGAPIRRASEPIVMEIALDLRALGQPELGEPIHPPRLLVDGLVEREPVQDDRV